MWTARRGRLTEAQKRFAKNFPALDEKQKNQLLTDASATPAKKNSGGAEARERRAGLHEHFENLKGWDSGAYYSSEAGMRDWDGPEIMCSQALRVASIPRDTNERDSMNEFSSRREFLRAATLTGAGLALSNRLLRGAE